MSLAAQPQEAALNPHTVLDHDDMHHLVNGLSLEVTRQAYEQAGVTNRPEWAAADRARGATRRRWRFAVFERDGLDCHACGRIIERASVASRRLYACPGCQPPP